MTTFEDGAWVERTGSNRITTRLERLVPRKYERFNQIPKGLCWHCGEMAATQNFHSYCKRCWFYMKNQYNKLMWEEEK